MSSTDKKGPSATEALLFFSILKNNRAKTEVDWDAVAQEAGFKNASTAKVRFGQIKKKHGLSESSPAKGSSGLSSDPSTPTKVRKATAPRKTARASRAVKKETQYDDDLDDFDMEGEMDDVKPEDEDGMELSH